MYSDRESANERSAMGRTKSRSRSASVDSCFEQFVNAKKSSSNVSSIKIVRR